MDSLKSQRLVSHGIIYNKPPDEVSFSKGSQLFEDNFELTLSTETPVQLFAIRLIYLCHLTNLVLNQNSIRVQFL